MGVVGSLQFDVLADRITSEYEIPVVFETAGLYTARWAEADEAPKLADFISKNESYMAEDHTGAQEPQDGTDPPTPEQRHHNTCGGQE